MVKQKYNPKTGQITTNPEVAKNVGATQDFNPSGITKIISAPAGLPEKGTDITNMSPQEQERISLINAIAGQTLKKEQLTKDVLNVMSVAPTQSQQDLIAKIGQVNAPTKTENMPYVDEQGVTQNMQVQVPTTENKLTTLETKGVLNTGEILAGGVAGATAGAGVGAGIGTALAPATLGTSIPIGATIGGVVGFIGGVLGKMSFDERQNVKNGLKLYKLSKSNIGQILTRANSDSTYSSVQAISDFNQQVEDLRLSRDYIASENKGIKKFLSGGMEEQIEVEKWLENLPYLEQELARTIVQKDPLKSFNFNEVTLNE